VVALALEHQPVLIVLDLMMPRMDGYTVLARLRGHRSTKTIPAIVLTGQAEPVYRALSAGLGAVAHVTKPFSPRAFTDTVRRLVADGSP
jgi:CheY-like chemotaxis protein